MPDTTSINLSAWKSPLVEELSLASSKLELELLLPAPVQKFDKVDKKDFTFVIPIYQLVEQKLKNFLWILPQIAATNCKIIVIEQVDTPKFSVVKELNTTIKEILKPFSNIKHVVWLKEQEEDDPKFIHRTALLNYAIKYHVDTEWVWVNDPDVFVKWLNIFPRIDPVYDYVLPYRMCKYIDRKTTESILNYEQTDICFADLQSGYTNVVGSHSFICRRQNYIKIGGMDENYKGNHIEGLDFNRKLILHNTPIQTIASQQAFRLHNKDIDNYPDHPRHEEILRMRSAQQVKLEAKFGTQASSLETVDDKIITSWRSKKPKFRHRNDMAVITCHFNWSGYKRPVANLNRFIRYMESRQIPVYGVELSLTGNFATKGNENWLQIKCKEENILFQKECLLNLAEKLVPQKYTKIAWFDHDVFLDNETWYDEVSFALDHKQIVQVFEYCYWTTEIGTIAKELPAMAKHPPVESSWTGHPGFGIAAKREMWGPKIGGLYPYCPLGHGDTVFMYSIFEVPISMHTQIGVGLNNCPDFPPYHEWYKNIVDFAACKPVGSGEGKGAVKLVGYAQGNCIHEWHGDIFNRSYVDRAFLMTWYNPSKNIFINGQGILELRNTPATWSHMIQKYFIERREDGTLLEGENL